MERYVGLEPTVVSAWKADAMAAMRIPLKVTTKIDRVLCLAPALKWNRTTSDFFCIKCKPYRAFVTWSGNRDLNSDHMNPDHVRYQVTLFPDS